MTLLTWLKVLLARDPMQFLTQDFAGTTRNLELLKLIQHEPGVSNGFNFGKLALEGNQQKKSRAKI